jgi:hypothetical protein
MNLVSERALRTTWKPLAALALDQVISLQLLHLIFLQDPLTMGAPRAALIHAGDVGEANSVDDMSDAVRAAGDAFDTGFQLPPS